MRLVRQVSLYFREGNSDKVYEVDLCSTGNDKYVVNFRYGRRGTALKEGTKTPEPVSLYKAEEIYQALEAEKRSKGYQSLTDSPAQHTSIPATPPKTPLNLDQLPPGAKKAILQRLQAAVEKKVDTRFPWKTSRVIWAAGILKMEEAVDSIYFLAAKGDMMQQYAAIWALGRCGARQAIPLFATSLKSGTQSLQRIAAAALLKVTDGKEKERQIQFQLHSLAEPFQAAIKNNDLSAITALLQERVLSQENPHYNFLEDLYLLSHEYAWLKSPLKEVLLAIPLRPNYFKHVRHIFKLAEFFDDFETLALLAHRFEKEEEQFSISSRDHEEHKKELSKRNSSLAYSNRTRAYFIRRVLRSLDKYGNYEDVNYVKLATSLLLWYNKDTDYKPPYSTYDYVWVKGNYERVEKKFPANANAVYLNQVLFGKSPTYRLHANNTWMTVDPEAVKTQSANKKSAAPGQSPWLFGEGFVQKLVNFFTGKKSGPAPQQTSLPTNAEENINRPQEQVTADDDAPFISLWNQLPQAYVELLMHGRMDEIHQFAMANLQKHPGYDQIKEDLDAAAIEQLLLSAFSIPAEFAFTLALERYQPSNPDVDLVKAMLYGKLQKAQSKAMEWVEGNRDVFLHNPSFVSAILLCPNANCRNWITQLISGITYTPAQSTDIVNRTLMHVLSFGDNSPGTNETIQHAGSSLAQHFSNALRSVPLQVVEHLLHSKTAGAQVLGVDILLLQKENINVDELSNETFYALIDSPYAPLRVKGMELMNTLTTAELLKRQELVMHCCTIMHRDVRNGVRPIIKRMAAHQPDFGVHAAEWLLPLLLRKEGSEGLHEDVAAILKEELIDYIKGVNKELALRLLYSDFVPTQKFGIAILEKHIDAKDLTIRQIIALGNHETLSVREWTWRYFENNISRIKYEREDAIRLLDVSWNDSREFAKGFFKKHFEEGDWTPEVLVGLADSVRPDIEAYGRELITRFFRDEQGEEYLIKLSQHPSEKMQLFATNYLERFAAGDVAKLQSLEFYFRSVLTRVNKARVAKNRIFRFLNEEGRKSDAAARFVAAIVSEISATVSIEDKAKCIEILLALQTLYDVQSPVKKKAVEERISS
jgi:predicted DNA-binding WGR domain protein